MAKQSAGPKPVVENKKKVAQASLAPSQHLEASAPSPEMKKPELSPEEKEKKKLADAKAAAEMAEHNAKYALDARMQNEKDLKSHPKFAKLKQEVK